MYDLTKKILAMMLISIAISAVECSGNPSNVVLAEEVLAKIRAGELVRYDHAIIIGSLSLDPMGMPQEHIERTKTLTGFLNISNNLTLVRSLIYINDSIIIGPVNLGDTLFLNPITFRNTKFENSVSFAGSVFEDYTDFTRSIFYDTIDFSGSEFNDKILFVESEFNNTAYFTESQFGDTTFFIRPQFDRDVFFIGSQFNGDTSFKESLFKQDASFSLSQFNGNMDFWGARFDNSMDFSESQFNNLISFKDCKFYGTSDFSKSEFVKDIDFNNAKFDGKVSFKSSTFIGDGLFQDANFGDELCLISTKYNKLYIRWGSISSLTYDDTAYQLLINNFRLLGFQPDADNCYYQFRVQQLLHRTILGKPITFLSDFIHWKPIEDPLLSLFDFFAWILYGYGKKPSYPLLWSIFFIGLFGVFWIAISLLSPNDAISRYNLSKGWLRRAISPFFIMLIIIIWKAIGLEKSKIEIDEYDQAGNWPNGMREAITFSATVFLSGTKLFVDPPAVPSLTGMSQTTIRRAFLLERVLGAFFFILFFLALGETIVR